MSTFLIKNAKAIVTVDDNDRVLYDSDILIKDQMIVKIEKNIPEEETLGAEVINAEDMIVYPGLINTHHHFFQTFVRNLTAIDIANIDLRAWLTAVYSIFRFINNDSLYYSSLSAMADLIKHGCTTAFDHQYCFTPSMESKGIDAQMAAAELIGMRFHAGRGTNTLPKENDSTMPDEMLETTDAFLKDCDRIIDLYHDPSQFSMKQVVMAPCQPINCYKETFTETIKMARDKHVYMHTHLCEGEVEGMLARYGKRSVAWCEEVGFVGPDVWWAHGAEILPEEYSVLASTGTGIAHCPAPMVCGGSNILDLKALDEAGVVVGLGCDGCASNDSSSMLDSLRIGYLMQSFHSSKRGGCVKPYHLVKMATRNGAKILGRSDIGFLEPGKAADLFMIDMGTLDMAGAEHNPMDLLPKIGVENNVYLTMINGRVVYRDGQFTTIDERALAKQGREVYLKTLRSRSPIYSIR